MLNYQLIYILRIMYRPRQIDGPARMIFGVIAPQSLKKNLNKFKNISAGLIVLRMVVSVGGT